MGGFEGGDEGGYWDIDTSPAGLNKENENKTRSMRSDIEKMVQSTVLKPMLRSISF
jgi:hypothetical protein